MTEPCPICKYHPGSNVCSALHRDPAALTSSAYLLSRAHQAEYDKLAAENDRLAARVVELERQITGGWDASVVAHLGTELSKAQAAVGDGADDARWPPGKTAVDALIAERDAARAEIERLKLQAVIDARKIAEWRLAAELAVEILQASGTQSELQRQAVAKARGE